MVELPLQLDSSNPDALEAGLRVYNGKAAVNSVNGEPEALARVLPIVKKYGASVVGLTMDQDGIPQTAEKRVEIAKRILDAALACGIPTVVRDIPVYGGWLEAGKMYTKRQIQMNFNRALRAFSPAPCRI